jgi:hypothetical protein
MRPIPTLATVLILAAVVSAHSEGDAKPDPASVAKQFYKTYLKLRPTGLPTEAQMKELAPLLSRELNDLIAKARREQQKFIRGNPNEKPPWIEGNLFASLFEGAHSYSLGTPVFTENNASFPVTLEYRERGKPVRWVDVIALENTNGEWKVRDIFLNGPWDFKAGPSLRAALSSE